MNATVDCFSRHLFPLCSLPNPLATTPLEAVSSTEEGLHFIKGCEGVQ